MSLDEGNTEYVACATCTVWYIGHGACLPAIIKAITGTTVYNNVIGGTQFHISQQIKAAGQINNDLELRYWTKIEDKVPTATEQILSFLSERAGRCVWT